MPPVILLFAKAPVPGQVKTRLQSHLSADQCASLHRCITEDVLATLAGFSDSCDVELHLNQPTSAWTHFPFPRRLQEGQDLGERMLKAAQNALARGYSKVLLLGSDAPDLPPAHIQAMLSLDAPLAFGPAEDGGYWAVQFQAAPAGLFDSVPWSAPDTLACSIRRASDLGLPAQLGPSWYDIDSLADLQRLAASNPPPSTRAWLDQHDFLVNPALLRIR
jgi:rSAM/selenodomain-associated transferase 1